MHRSVGFPAFPSLGSCILEASIWFTLSLWVFKTNKLLRELLLLLRLVAPPISLRRWVTSYFSTAGPAPEHQNRHWARSLHQQHKPLPDARQDKSKPLVEQTSACWSGLECECEVEVVWEHAGTGSQAALTARLWESFTFQRSIPRVPRSSREGSSSSQQIPSPLWPQRAAEGYLGNAPRSSQMWIFGNWWQTRGEVDSVLLSGLSTI